jgi:hypothetical protein
MLSQQSLVLSLALLTSSTSFALTPWPESYGFDWLHPEQAKCEKIAPAQVKTFSSCSYLAEGGFDGSATAYLCSVNPQSEYMLFMSQSICQQQLQTLLANAP